jgi:hypothetical protein
MKIFSRPQTGGNLYSSFVKSKESSLDSKFNDKDIKNILNRSGLVQGIRPIVNTSKKQKVGSLI